MTQPLGKKPDRQSNMDGPSVALVLIVFMLCLTILLMWWTR